MKNVFPHLLVENANGTVEVYMGKQGLDEGAKASSQGESATWMTREEAEFEFEIVDGVIDTRLELMKAIKDVNCNDYPNLLRGG